MRRKYNQSVQFSVNAKLVFNISIVGEKSVGKSSLIIRQIKDTFGKLTKSSEGFQFYSKTFNIKNQQVSLQIWDTVGKSQYKSMTRNFFRQAASIVIVYDKIDNLITQIDSLCKQLKQFANDNVKLCLIRTKIDSFPVTQQQKQTIRLICEQKFPNTIFYTGQVSSKKNQNVHQYFLTLMNKLYQCYEQDEQFRQAMNPNKDNSIILNKNQQRFSLKQKKGCC